MSRYNPEWKLPVAFPPVSMDNVLAEWLGKQGVKQMHIAGELMTARKLADTPQRPRSTRTSPSSSTVVSRSSTRARAVS